MKTQDHELFQAQNNNFRSGINSINEEKCVEFKVCCILYHRFKIQCCSRPSGLSNPLILGQQSVLCVCKVGNAACHPFITPKNIIKKRLIKSGKSYCIIKAGESIFFPFLWFVKFLKYYISLQLELHTV